MLLTYNIIHNVCITHTYIYEQFNFAESRETCFVSSKKKIERNNDFERVKIVKSCINHITFENPFQVKCFFASQVFDLDNFIELLFSQFCFLFSS